MSKLRFAVNILAIAVFSLAVSSVAQAQATRTWVSGVGDDANPCSRTAPCKTFAGAISKTAACGEISVLDPGGFGAVTITKSITINGDGTLAGILAAGVNGIIINAGVNDKIILRSISINGACTGLNGIRFLAGKHLHVENCTIYGFTQNGIDMNLPASTFGELSVTNTSFTNITLAAVSQTAGAGAVPTSQLSNVRINSTGTGVAALLGNSTVSRSFISHVANEGLKAQNSGTVNAVSTTVTNSGTGLSAATSGSKVNFANCDFLNNSTGLTIVSGATGNRFGNSRIFNNSVDENVAGTLNNPANR